MYAGLRRVAFVTGINQVENYVLYVRVGDARCRTATVCELVFLRTPSRRRGGEAKPQSYWEASQRKGPNRLVHSRVTCRQQRSHFMQRRRNRSSTVQSQGKPGNRSSTVQSQGKPREPEFGHAVPGKVRRNTSPPPARRGCYPALLFGVIPVDFSISHRVDLWRNKLQQSTRCNPTNDVAHGSRRQFWAEAIKSKRRLCVL